jgi:hypothetical protein
MKVNKSLLKQVEREIRKYGLKVAIENVLWLSASEQLKDIGATRVTTHYAKRKPSAKDFK